MKLVSLAAASESVFTYGTKGEIGYEIAEKTSLYSEAKFINYAFLHQKLMKIMIQITIS